MKNDQTCLTQLLSDDPAKADAFGSHDKLATALAELVSKEDGGRAIALIGSWGSGKSTTVRLLADQLTDSTKVFIFNAWTHQGDPLRRSFLEQLIDALDSYSWIVSAKKWSAVRAQLAKRERVQDITTTPLFTGRGKLLALLLLGVPPGLTMLGKLGQDNIASWIPYAGALLSLFPFIYILLLLLANSLRPRIRSIAENRKWRWLEPFGSEKKEDVFEILLNKSISKTRSETSETPDPTSIEFKQHFDRLLKESLARDSRRLVIVIDNLDRVDTEQALSLWSTMSTFFDFAPNTDRENTDREWVRSLWLVVPFDHSALSRLWPDRNGSDAPDSTGETKKAIQPRPQDLANAFADKTFAITFHVPPPLLSDLRTYIEQGLEQALPDHNHEDFHGVYRIFRLASLDDGRPPTPRDAKIFINKLGAIHRQWQDEIALPIQALYVALAKTAWRPEEELATGDEQQILGRIPVELIGSEWRSSLAAIHFNASRDKALQVLLSTQVESALIAGDGVKLESLQGIHGITQVVEEIIETNSSSWSTSETTSLSMSASALASLHIDDDPSLNRSWKLLCDASANVTSWSRLDEATAGGLLQMLKRRRDADFAKSILTSVAASPVAGGETDKPAPAEAISSWLGGVATVLRELKRDHAATIEQSFSVPGSAGTYIAIMSQVAPDADLDDVYQYFKPTALPSNVVAELVPSSTEGTFDELRSGAVVRMLLVPAQWPWTDLVTALKDRLQASNTVDPPEITASLLTLHRLTMVEPQAKTNLKLLVEEGHIAHHLYQCNASSDDKSIALCMLTIMQEAPDGSLSQSPGNAASGISTYKEILSDPTAHAGVVAQFADLVVGFSLMPSLYEMASGTPTAAAFVAAVLNRVATSNKACKNITPDQIIGQYEYLQSNLDKDALEALIKESVVQSSLSKKLIEHGFETNLAALYLRAYGGSDSDPEYSHFLIDGLMKSARETWAKELSKEGSLLELLIVLVNDGHELGLEIALEDALEAHARQLLTGHSKVERFRDSWESVLKALSDSARETLLGRLIAILCDEDRPTDALLGLYGERLAADQVLRGHDERLVLLAFTKFLSRRRVAELTWLSSALKSRQELLSSIKQTTREDFENRVRETHSQAENDEELRRVVEQIAETAGIDLTSESDEDGEN